MTLILYECQRLERKEDRRSLCIGYGDTEWSHCRRRMPEEGTVSTMEMSKQEQGGLHRSRALIYCVCNYVHRHSGAGRLRKSMRGGVLCSSCQGLETLH